MQLIAIRIDMTRSQIQFSFMVVCLGIILKTSLQIVIEQQVQIIQLYVST